MLILIFAAEATGQDRKTLYGAAGTVLASAYLYKVAALIFVPAVLGLSCVLFFDRVKSVAGRLKGFLLTAGLLAGPLLVTVISWSAAVDANNCSPFSLSAEQMAEAASLDWKDLAVRFGSAVGSYIIGYKFILTLTAGFGVIGAFATGKYRAMLVLTLLSCAYFMLLYVFHLTCFGPFCKLHCSGQSLGFTTTLYRVQDGGKMNIEHGSEFSKMEIRARIFSIDNGIHGYRQSAFVNLVPYFCEQKAERFCTSTLLGVVGIWG